MIIIGPYRGIPIFFCRAYYNSNQAARILVGQNIPTADEAVAFYVLLGTQFETDPLPDSHELIQQRELECRTFQL